MKINRRGTLAPNKAFSLIEVIVVMAIIGVLISISLPAVQQVRASASKIKCSNNIKQQCLAVHYFALHAGQFPSGYNGFQDKPGWGWGAQILPLLEQQSLYKDLNIVQPFGGGANPAQPNALTQSTLSVFRCPSDKGPPLNDRRLNHALSNYRGVAGVNTPPSVLWNQDTGGVMFQNSNIKFDDIEDGTSHTLLIGECMYDTATNKSAAIWVGMTGVVNGASRFADVIWWVDGDAAQINGTGSQAFSSRHRSGASFGYCDGSVRFFRDKTSPDILKWQAGRKDGVRVPDDF